MKRSLALGLLVAILMGCGIGEIGETMEGDIQSQDDPVIQNTLQAINVGLTDGDRVMTHEVNKVLLFHNLSIYSYQGMSDLQDFQTMSTEDIGGPADCPYVGPRQPTGSETGPASCRYLAEEALDAGLLARGLIDPNKAIPASFGGSDGNVAEYRTWYTTATKSAVEITAVLMAGTLRKEGVCDQKATPKQGAKEKGILLGRKLYIEAMNERLKQLGIDYVYPKNNGKKATNSIRYCKANLRTPALQDAQARIASATKQSPLCPGIGGSSVEQSTFASQYQAVEKDYEAGVYSGAMQEDTLAQGILTGGGCCLGSPLVLDLAADGIQAQGKVQFDLLATGSKVSTGWVAADDALLVRDADGNGKIDDATELFGNAGGHRNGFLALAAHDSNSDGLIDAGDPVYSELRLWQDADANGESSPDELSTLSSMGVKAIELRYTEERRVDSGGNQFRQTARFIRTGEFAAALGATGQVVDVWFYYE